MMMSSGEMAAARFRFGDDFGRHDVFSLVYK
jgi:hypothetical protein